MDESLKNIYLSAVESSQHCQRNWDYEKTIDIDQIKWLWNVGTTTPTKENVDSFDISVVTDRTLITEISKVATNNPSYQEEWGQFKDRVQNPQTLAHAVFLFWLREELSVTELRDDRGRMSFDDWYNVVMAEIGISASAVAVAANLMGLKTGFCRCIDFNLITTKFKKKFDRHPEDRLMLILGIGHPLTDRPHNYHNNKNYHNPTFKKDLKTFNIY